MYLSGCNIYICLGAIYICPGAIYICPGAICICLGTIYRYLLSYSYSYSYLSDIKSYICLGTICICLGAIYICPGAIYLSGRQSTCARTLIFTLLSELNRLNKSSFKLGDFHILVFDFFFFSVKNLRQTKSDIEFFCLNLGEISRSVSRQMNLTERLIEFLHILDTLSLIY